MDVETAGHNHKETQNCSRVLDKSRKIEAADHDYKETQNCSRVLDKSRNIEAADHDYKETQNCSRVLDKSRKVETHPSFLLSSLFSLFFFLPLYKFVYKR